VHWHLHVHTGFSICTLKLAAPTGICMFTLGFTCSHWGLQDPLEITQMNPYAGSRTLQNLAALKAYTACSGSTTTTFCQKHEAHKVMHVCWMRGIPFSRATPARAPCWGSRWAQSGGCTATTRAELAHKELRRLHTTRVMMGFILVMPVLFRTHCLCPCDASGKWHLSFRLDI